VLEFCEEGDLNSYNLRKWDRKDKDKDKEK
jgi:hypothetical protein